MAELSLTEIEFRIALLPPISRRLHLAGPSVHAERLVTLWRLGAGDDVPLAQAFRLLDVEKVAGAILRTLAAGKYPSGDPRHWHFPGLEDLLPELRALAWQAMLIGALTVEAVKGVRGTRRRAILPAELPRLQPDWQLSRLRQGTRDEFIDVQVRRALAAPVKKSWREPLSDAELEAAALKTAKAFSPGVIPTEAEFHAELNKHLPRPATREAARAALKSYAPQLRGRPGYRKTSKT